MNEDNEFEKNLKKRYEESRKSTVFSDSLTFPEFKGLILKYATGEIAKNLYGEEKLKNRTIILNLHMIMEGFVNIILAAHYLRYGSEEERNCLVNEVLFRVSFAKKAALIRELGLYKKHTVSKILAINDLRNAFAHNFPKSHGMFKYNEKSIFEKGTINVVLDDFELIVMGHQEAMQYATRLTAADVLASTNK